MSSFSNLDVKREIALRDQVIVGDFDAAVDYLRRFTEGLSVDRDTVIRALAIVAIDPFWPVGAA